MAVIEIIVLLIVLAFVALFIALPLIFSSKQVKSLDPSSEDYRSRMSKDGTAVAGYICAAVSFLMWLIPLFGLVSSILGIVFSSIGLSSNRRILATCGLAYAIFCLVMTILNMIYGYEIGFALGQYAASMM